MRNFLTDARNHVLLAVPALGALASATTAFASGSSTPDVAITAEMLAPVIDAVTANIGVILPIGISIFGILLGVGLVPTLIKKFTKG